MLSNPRPSQGYNAVLGNIPASSAPPQGALASMNPSVRNNVKEPMVNAVASYPILVQPWSNNMERYLHPGDLIFVYINAKDSTNNGAPRRGQPTVVANLPILNFLMSCDTGNHAFQKFADPCCWHFFGVMRNDMQMNQGELGINHRYKRYRRLINVDVRGATRCFNYWGDADQGRFAYLHWVWMLRRGARNENGEELLHAEEVHKLEKAKNEAVDAYVQRNGGRLRVSRDQAERDLRDGNRNALQSEIEASENFYGRYVQQLLPAVHARECHPNFALMSKQADYQEIFDAARNPRVTHFPVGWCFQHVGAAERVSSMSCVIAASNFQEDRFKLPLFNLFIRT